MRKIILIVGPCALVSGVSFWFFGVGASTHVSQSPAQVSARSHAASATSDLFAAPTPKEPDPQKQTSVRHNSLRESSAGILSDPKMKETLSALQIVQIQRDYEEFFKENRLSVAKRDALVACLARRAAESSTAVATLFSKETDDKAIALASASLGQIFADSDAEIDSVLEDQSLADAFRRYTDVKPEKTVVSRLGMELERANLAPLSEDARKSLVSALRDERARVFGKIADNDITAFLPPAALSEEQRQLRRTRQAVYSEAALLRAEEILTPEQFTVFARRFERNSARRPPTSR